MNITQPAPALLQIGFEQKGDLSRGCVARLHRAGQLRQPPVGVVAPLGPGSDYEGIAQRCVTAQMPSVEQRRRRGEIVFGDGERFVDGSNRMAELLTVVPDRVPHATGDVVDVAAPGVHKKRIEVAAWRELVTPVSARREKSQSLCVIAEDLAQPSVGRSRQPLAERQTHREPGRRGRSPGPCEAIPLWKLWTRLRAGEQHSCV